MRHHTTNSKFWEISYRVLTGATVWGDNATRTHIRRVGHVVCAWEQSQAKSRTALPSDLTQMVTSKEKLKAPDSSPLCFTCMLLEQPCRSVCLLCKQSCQEEGSMACWRVQLCRLFENLNPLPPPHPLFSLQLFVSLWLNFCMFFKTAACLRWTILLVHDV